MASEAAETPETTETNTTFTEKPDFKCEVCRLTVNSQFQLQQHLVGKAHLKKVAASELAEAQATGLVSAVAVKRKAPSSGLDESMCSICGCMFNSPSQAAQHYSGTKHIKKKKMAEAGEMDGNGDVKRPVAGNLFCAFCNVHVNSQDQLDIHRQGTKHRKNFNKLTNMKTQLKSPAVADSPLIPESEVPKTLPSFESYLTTSFVKGGLEQSQW